MTKKLNAYERVANELTTRIDKKMYSVSQRLPSEYDLAKEFEVSRLTVRKAIDLLVSKNRLIKHRGKGTYVMAQAKIPSGSLGLQGFTEVAHARGMKPETKLIQFKEAHLPPSEIQAELALDPTEMVYLITRLRLANAEPMIIEEIYIPTKYLSSVAQVDLETKSLFALIEEKIEIGYSHQEVGAESVDAFQSELLAVPIGVPILQVHSVAFSFTNVPIMIDNSYYRADKYTFKNILQRKR